MKELQFLFPQLGINTRATQVRMRKKILRPRKNGYFWGEKESASNPYLEVGEAPQEGRGAFELGSTRWLSEGAERQDENIFPDSKVIGIHTMESALDSWIRTSIWNPGGCMADIRQGFSYWAIVPGPPQTFWSTLQIAPVQSLSKTICVIVATWCLE